MTFSDTNEAVVQWHYARNLIHGTTDSAQLLKLHEEVDELVDALFVEDHKEMVDAIGDIMVVLANIAERNKTSLEFCYTSAYEEIKDRKGKMVDGLFVKEIDDERSTEV